MRKKRFFWQVFSAFFWITLLALAALTGYGVATLQDFSWEHTPEAFEAQRAGLQIQFVLVGAFLAVGAGMVGFWVARRGVRPLEELGQQAQGLAEGTREAPLPIPPHEELATVAGAFNEMVAQRKERTHTIERLENVRQDFVANVSHELKTPISSIKGSVETLLDGAFQDPENATRFLHIIARHTDRLNAIIEDLLTLARIEQQKGATHIPTQPSALWEIFHIALEDCEHQIAEKRIQMTVVCAKTIQAKTNAPLLQHALVNLVSNAIKYSDPSSPVEVRGEQTRDEVIIHVQDWGRGIEKQHLPRLFERFYRVDPARHRNLGGTGLGLAIVKHIAQAHEGHVSVKSRIHVGSTFSIHLPRGKHD